MAKMVYLAVDTGATTSIISPHVARAIGCDPDPLAKNVAIITASGFVYMHIVKVPRIDCLGAQVTNLDVICHQLPTESTVEGLLGLDFLRHVPLFQEFEKKILDLSQP